ncbi:hypothetical protein CONLIGDRAFT_346671 [Coniochaeta ligniaria NRRL 30616]|uniref:Uncharacterized protein n=1 Tax=Coniochaeta ligniaria NRRL 30616 TaxID=1408157 RepID=A0A1J7IQT2_9PEZI|nr:hypothetical protein CONLIGDRAFT_346671 [Coniochaeta ligniaria NRRL 30616]
MLQTVGTRFALLMNEVTFLLPRASVQTPCYAAKQQDVHFARACATTPYAVTKGPTSSKLAARTGQRLRRTPPAEPLVAALCPGRYVAHPLSRRENNGRHGPMSRGALCLPRTRSKVYTSGCHARRLRLRGNRPDTRGQSCFPWRYRRVPGSHVDELGS